jgi:hypothetical protein
MLAVLGMRDSRLQVESLPKAVNREILGKQHLVHISPECESADLLGRDDRYDKLMTN